MNEKIDECGHLDMQSSWGVVRITASNSRIIGCELTELDTRPACPFSWKDAVLEASDPADREVLRHAGLFVHSVLLGRSGSLPPLCVPESTVFRKAVWRAIADIPRGRTRTYGDIASSIGSPDAARAVGTACGANHLPLFIPCHRVTGSGGKLGGFTGGLAWKEHLLAVEEVPLPGDAASASFFAE